MELFTSITILVVILGVAIILAVVWLVYKYRVVKAKIRLGIQSMPPVRKMVIQRGKIVPASNHLASSVRLGLSSPSQAYLSSPKTINSHPTSQYKPLQGSQTSQPSGRESIRPQMVSPSQRGPAKVGIFSRPNCIDIMPLRPNSLAATGDISTDHGSKIQWNDYDDLERGDAHVNPLTSIPYKSPLSVHQPGHTKFATDGGPGSPSNILR